MAKPYHLQLLEPNDEDKLRRAIKSFKNADVEYTRAIQADTQPRLNKAGTRYAIAKYRLFKLAGLEKQAGGKR
jgi:hypothetical protein